LIKESDGILSLYNSNSHPVVKKIDDVFLLKSAVGSAGALFQRRRVEEIIRAFPKPVDHFDWMWSQYFSNVGTNIYCLNNSLVQHIGYYGQHHAYSLDYGENFTVDSIFNGQAINDVFALFLENNHRIVRDLPDKDLCLKYHLKRIFEILPTKIFKEKEGKQ